MQDSSVSLDHHLRPRQLQVGKHLDGSFRARAFGLAPNKVTAAFIDARNFEAACSAVGIDLDYAALRQILAEETDLLRIYHYRAFRISDVNKKSEEQLAWLSENGFAVKFCDVPDKPLIFGQEAPKLNMDVDLATDMFDSIGTVAQIVLFSGDEAFVSAVKLVQRKGIQVTVVGTKSGNVAAASARLIMQADRFVEITTLCERRCKNLPR